MLIGKVENLPVPVDLDLHDGNDACMLDAGTVPPLSLFFYLWHASTKEQLLKLGIIPLKIPFG